LLLQVQVASGAWLGPESLLRFSCFAVSLRLQCETQVLVRELSAAASTWLAADWKLGGLRL